MLQWNTGQEAYVLHGDQPGDPYPNDPTFVAGGGGFGSTVANVTLREPATVLYQVYGGDDEDYIATVMFRVEPRSIWAMELDALWYGSHGVLPDHIRDGAPRQTRKGMQNYRVSLNMRFGQISHEECVTYWHSLPGNEEFQKRWSNSEENFEEFVMNGGAKPGPWKEGAAMLSEKKGTRRTQRRTGGGRM